MLFFSIDILCLIAFKYIFFLGQSLSILMKKINLSWEFTTPEIFVPLGISFIIFQVTTYIGDIYKGKIKAQKYSTCALFISFFPTILSGPISKAHELIPEFNLKKEIDEKKFAQGVFLIAVGFFSKLFVADNLAPIVNRVFDNYTQYGGPYFLIAAACYSLQIYADFSSYSDIARGTALLFGIYVKDNFDKPYLSQNLVEFWKKWHMSLNSWFVEYIYIPLGGNKKGNLRKYINILIVFSVSGLWHGASWNFVVWGVLNGILQIVGKITSDLRIKFWSLIGLSEGTVVKRCINSFCVFISISTLWIYFRSPSIEVANYIIAEIGHCDILQFFQNDVWSILGSTKEILSLIIYVILFIAISISGKEKGKIFASFLMEPLVLRIVLLSVYLAVIIVCVCGKYASSDATFIYFQF